mmetsp:Transcript_21556/g.39105  ORF Transcript_21556/g.39105 Transcript_21556/m.39105 type:complete len:110 (-) Transcript_21556:67-396(-)
MGNFFSNAVQAGPEPEAKLGSKSKSGTLQLLMIGLDSSGKTTILYKIKNKREKVVTAIPTIGFNLETTSTHGTAYVVWDMLDDVRRFVHLSESTTHVWMASFSSSIPVL